MISKKMYDLLKHIPHAPESTTFSELDKIKLMDINRLKVLVKDAQKTNYIAFSNKTPYSDIIKDKFSLTELGQVAIEEYKRQLSTDRKATLALVLSIISIIITLAPTVMSMCVK